MNKSFQYQIEEACLYDPITQECPWFSFLSTRDRDITLVFHQKLYPIKALKTACSAFQDLVKTKIISVKPYHKVVFSFVYDEKDGPCHEEVCSSFVNHVLVASFEERKG